MINKSNFMSKQATICLSMIVKDEEHIILRCLESVKDTIDYWVISDTGSTDNTKKIIKDFFKKHNIPGELHSHQWENFSHNRNKSLTIAVEKADYVFIIDADDVLIHEDNFRFKNLSKDGYSLTFKETAASYTRTSLIKSSKDWRWAGVLHEYLECSIPFTIETYPEGYIKASREGARGQNPDRFKADVDILKKALLETPDNARYQFYLAQSYRDDQDFTQAMQAYQKRADMGGWAEEIYYSLYEVGNCQLKLDMDSNTVLESLLKAYYFRPSRLEAIYLAVQVCRIEENYHLGYHLGYSAIKTPEPKDALFVSTDVHQWQLKDELAICASRIGLNSIAKEMINDILKLDNLTADTRTRLNNNLKFC